MILLIVELIFFFFFVLRICLFFVGFEVEVEVVVFLILVGVMYLLLKILGLDRNFERMLLNWERLV